MKKIFALALVFAGLSFGASAQSYIGLEGGASIPTGKQGSEDFAETGGTFGLHGAYFFNESLGLGYNFNGSTQSVNQDAARIGNNAFSYTQGDYGYAFYGLGLASYIPIGDSSIFGIRSRILVGAMVGSQGLVVAAFEDGVGGFTVIGLPQTNAVSIGLDFGIGGELKLGKHWGLGLNLDAYFGKPEYEYIIAGNLNRYQQRVSYLNTTIGINYLF